MTRLIIFTILISIACLGTIAMADGSDDVYTGSDSSANIVTNGDAVYLLCSSDGIFGNYSTLCRIIGESRHDICHLWYGKDIAIVGDMLLVKAYTTVGVFSHTTKELHIHGFWLFPPFERCFHTYCEHNSEITTSYHFAFDRILACTHDASCDDYRISVVSVGSDTEAEILVVGNPPSIHSTYAAFKDDSDIEVIKILGFQTMKTYVMPEGTFRAYGMSQLPQGVLLNEKLFFLQSDGIYLMDFHENSCRIVVPVDQPQYFFVADDVLYTRYNDETLVVYSIATGTSAFYKCSIDQRERYVVAGNMLYIAEYSPNSQARVNSYRSIELVVTE